MQGGTGGVLVQPGGKAVKRQKRFHLRSKDEPGVVSAEVKRLNAEAVARQEQSPFDPVPNGEGPHAIEAQQTILAPLGVGGDHDLGVGLAAEAMAQPLQLPAQLQEIVYLAVVGDPVALTVVPAIRHGVSAIVAEIENGEASVPKAEIAVDQQSPSVRAAMGQGIGEAAEFIRTDGGSGIEDAGDAAHSERLHDLFC